MFGIVKVMSAVTLLAAVGPIGARAVKQPPTGWFLGGDDSEYRAGQDVSRRPGGYGYFSATLQSIAVQPMNFGLLKQTIRADDFRGKRVRLTGYIRTAERNDGTAHLWMRVNTDDGNARADYMLTRPVLPGTDWTSYSVVLDVPANAVGVTFGLGLVGAGQAWLDDVTLEVVGRDVAVTAEGDAIAFRDSASRYATAVRQPINLDFEQQSIAMR
jgi:hypothetical protein